MKSRWFLLRTGLVDLGELPDWLDEDDPDSAAQQIHKHYGHGGGWHPFKGDPPAAMSRLYELCYPGDPPLMPLAGTKLRHELIFLYPHSWLAIVQPDRTFEVARVD